MISFKKYIENINRIFESFDNLDMEFLNNAEKVSSFNLVTKDFESLQYKKEIQFLFTKHFFPEIQSNDLLDKLEENSFNSLVNKLKAINYKNFVKLHKYNLKGIGPGEVLMYYILNNAYLGGGSSAGLDIIDNDMGYELKSVEIYGGKYLSQFKLGGTINLSDIISGLLELKEKIKGSGEGVNRSTIEKIKEEYPKEYDKIEKIYKERTYKEYFSKHPIVFLNNSTKKVGEIITIKNVKKDDIFIHVVTSGTVKPLIRI